MSTPSELGQRLVRAIQPTDDDSSFCQSCTSSRNKGDFLKAIKNRDMVFFFTDSGIRENEAKGGSSEPHPSCPSCYIIAFAISGVRRRSEMAVDLFYYFKKSDTSSHPEYLQIFGSLYSTGLCYFRPVYMRTPNVNKFLEIHNGKKLDLSGLKESFGQCSSDHPTCRPTRYQPIVGLRMIDCCTGKIVQAPEDCRYVALSYVWGATSTTSYGPQNFPKTIADAMNVTQALGLSFLWVDRYCIDQTNTEARHTQIQQMGLIYGQAQLTIIAAAGSSPEYGLPGVSGARKGNRAIFRVRKENFYHFPLGTRELVSNSVWSTRGWTYQEYALSNRRLVFTEQQAAFECQCTFTEEWPISGLRDLCYTDLSFDYRGPNDDDILSFPKDMPGAKRFTETIYHYLKRKLTYQSDILNGLLGILATFEACSRPESIYRLMGVPYFLRGGKAILDLGWGLNDRDYDGRRFKGSTLYVQRRNLFPSWSWADWAGVPRFSWDYHTDAEHPGWSPLDDLRCWVTVKNGNTSQDLTLEEFTERRLGGALFGPSHLISVETWTLPAVISWGKTLELHVPAFWNEMYEMTLCESVFAKSRSKRRKKKVHGLRALLVGVRRVSCQDIPTYAELPSPMEDLYGLFGSEQDLGIPPRDYSKDEEVSFLFLIVKSKHKTFKRVGIAMTHTTYLDHRFSKSWLSTFQDIFPKAKKEQVRLK